MVPLQCARRLTLKPAALLLRALTAVSGTAVSHLPGEHTVLSTVFCSCLRSQQWPPQGHCRGVHPERAASSVTAASAAVVLQVRRPLEEGLLLPRGHCALPQHLLCPGRSSAPTSGTSVGSADAQRQGALRVGGARAGAGRQGRQGQEVVLSEACGRWAWVGEGTVGMRDAVHRKLKLENSRKGQVALRGLPDGTRSHCPLNLSASVLKPAPVNSVSVLSLSSLSVVFLSVSS